MHSNHDAAMACLRTAFLLAFVWFGLSAHAQSNQCPTGPATSLFSAITSKDMALQPGATYRLADILCFNNPPQPNPAPAGYQLVYYGGLVGLSPVQLTAGLDISPGHVLLSGETAPPFVGWKVQRFAVFGTCASKLEDSSYDCNDAPWNAITLTIPANYASTQVSLFINNGGQWSVTCPPGTTQTFCWSGAFSGGSTFIWTVQASLCKVANLPPVDPSVIAFENAAPAAPFESKYPDFVDAALSRTVTAFIEDALALNGVSLGRESGYRPLAYQQHLRDIRDKIVELNAAVAHDPNQETACQELRGRLNSEVIKHQLTTVNGIPSVSQPQQSLHTMLPAKALDMNGVAGLSKSKLQLLDLVAELNGLQRPCPITDPAYHITLRGLPCSERVKGGVKSPLDILVIDPLGRRVGYLASSGHVVNEIGQSAYYSGRGVEPQEVEIGDPVPGTYRIEGVGNGAGPYTLYLSRQTDEGFDIETVSSTGTASVGSVATLSLVKPLYIAIDIKPNGSPNSINAQSRGVVPVAILSRPNFYAPDSIDFSSLKFGRTGEELSLQSCNPAGEDVDHDGVLDLVCQFATSRTGFLAGDTQGILRGRGKSGTPIIGVDWIRIVP